MLPLDSVAHHHHHTVMYNHANQPIKFERDCEVVMIPSGEVVQMPAGTVGYITQALGGSFTVFVDGNLFRIAGQDGDAIGKDIQPPPTLPEGATKEDLEALIWQQIGTVYDPEIPISVVELGLIYSCALTSVTDDQHEVEIEMTLTAPGCGMGDILVADVRDKVELIPTISQAKVELTFEPPWNYEMMSEAARLQTGML